MVSFWTLGTVELRGSDGVELRAILAGSKRLALLTYLVTAQPRGFHRRDTLLALFWPEFTAESARNVLRNTLHVLRHALGEGVLVGRGSEEVGVAQDRLWCDAVAFEQALDARDPELALRLYRGSLLDGFFLSRAPSFEGWLEGARARLRARAAHGTCGFAEELAACGRPADAVHWARRAAELSADDEGAQRRLIALLDRLGDRAGALHVYTAFARHLAAEYDAEPSAETQALVRTLRTGRTHA